MICAEHISFSYDAEKVILQEVSLREDTGHCIALLGNNGVGKSTFLKCFNRILKPSKGTLRVEALDIGRATRKEIARTLAYVEQHTLAGRLTVYDTVLLGRKPHMKMAPSEEDYAITDRSIERLHLTDLRLRYTDELSGGELQKVMLARALAQQPKVLLLDEPTASLDIYNQHEVMKLAAGIAAEDGMTVMVVIHDLNLALKYCDRFLLMHDGKVFDYGDISIITPENIKAVYGVDTVIAQINGNKIVIVQ